MHTSALHPGPNPTTNHPINGAAALRPIKLPYPAPGAYTTTATPCSQAIQELGTLLFDFNSILYQSVFPPLHPLSLNGITESIQTFLTNLVGPLSQFTPQPLQFKQPNSIYSANPPLQKNTRNNRKLCQSLAIIYGRTSLANKTPIPAHCFFTQRTIQQNLQRHQSLGTASYYPT